MESLLLATFSATKSDAAEALELVEDYCHTQGLEERQSLRLRVVVEEVISNVVSHGFSDHVAGMIELTLEYDGNSFFVAVLDNGKAFDPLSHQPANTANLISSTVVGGLGIPLIKGFSDGVHYERRNNQNCIRLRISMD